MAIRLWFASFAIIPVPDEAVSDAAWDNVATSRPQVLVVGDPLSFPTVLGNFTKTDNVTGAHNVEMIRATSPCLDGDQTITGTVKGQFHVQENNAAADCRSQLVIRVIKPDNTVRGTLLAAHSNALSSEWSTTQTNRANPLLVLSPATLSSVAALDGDRLHVSAGARKSEASTTSRTLTIRSGTAGASDLPEDETTTSSLRSWIEFSQTLAFKGTGGQTNSLLLMGAGA